MTRFSSLQLILAAVVMMFSAAAAVGGAPPLLNLDEDGLALQGYDPVSYHGQGPAPGKVEFSASHDGALYHFSSRENLERFSANPELYLPALGGWCAWAMLDGEKVEIDPETYKIIDDSTYLFYHTFFVDTLSKWNQLAEKEPEAALIKRARARWSELIQKADSVKPNK